MNPSISNFDRLPDWDTRLADLSTVQLEVAPEWGSTDCLLTVGEAMEAVTGTNPLAKFKGKYTTEQGAAKLMRRHKCKTVEDVFEKYLKLIPVGRLSARRGDVGVMVIQGQLAAGYFTNHGFAVKQESGLGFFPVTEVKTAFRVGRD